MFSEKITQMTKILHDRRSRRSRQIPSLGDSDDDDYNEEEDEVDNNVVGMLRNELEEEVTARASPT